MIGYIVSALIIILTLGILKDTHVKVWEQGSWRPKLTEEYDLPVTIWQALVIILIGLIPVINVLGFTVFIVYYMVHALWNPEDCTGRVHIVSLNRRNLITKGLLEIKELLCKKI